MNFEFGEYTQIHNPNNPTPNNIMARTNGGIALT